MAVALTLCDRSEEMVRAWQRYFPLDLGVRIVKGNILTLPVEALAVPANSFGYTDGGIDLTISREIFDWRLQERLRAVIDRQYAGELLVGQALVMATGSDRFRYVVVAPTMRVPGDVSATINAYLAMRGILLAVEFEHERIRSIAVPGLATGVGKMPPERSAFQMYTAYRSIVLSDLEWTRSLDKQVEYDRKMREIGTVRTGDS
jgi:O-acetyl-ADP-ribose deacetylase (regulator of RNase III)